MYRFHAIKALLPLVTKKAGSPNPGPRQGYISDASAAEEDPLPTSGAAGASSPEDPYIQFAMQMLDTTDKHHPQLEEVAKLIRQHYNKITKPVASVDREDEAAPDRGVGSAGGQDALDKIDLPVDAGMQ